MTVFALLVSIIISSASLAWGFAERGLTSFSMWLLIFGAGWLLAVWKRWEWYSSLELFISIFSAAIGILLYLPPGWMLSGAIFALFAWDMNDFHRRLRSVVNDDNTREMERRHVARVSLLALAGLLLASATMRMRAQFTFEWTALLVIVIVLGLAQLVGWFRKMQ